MIDRDSATGFRAAYRTIFEQHSAVMLLIDAADARVVDANVAAARFYGYTREQMRGMPLGQINPLPAAQLRKNLDDAAASESYQFHVSHRVADGTLRAVSVHGSRIVINGRTTMFSIIEDETAHLEAQRKLARGLAVSGMIAGANNLVARARTRQELLNGICSLTLQQGGFVAAWVVTRADRGTIHVDSLPRTLPHDVQAYLSSQSTYVPDGPSQRAIRTGVPAMDRYANTRAPGADLLVARIGASVGAAIPFMEGGAWRGALNLLAKDPDAFGPDTIEMLVQLAANLTFGLDRLAHEADRARLTQELEAAETRWRFALDGAGHGVWEYDIEHNRSFHSPVFLNMLGYAAGDLGTALVDWADLLHPDDRDRVTAESERHMRGETTVYQCEHRMRRKDGSYIWVSATGRVVKRTPAGAPRLVVGTLVDVTPRVQAEEALRESEARYRRAVEGADEGIWDWELTTGAAHYSTRCKQLLGYEADQFPDTIAAFYDQVHENDLGMVQDALLRHTAAREPFRIEFRMRNRDGRYRWYFARGQAERDSAGAAQRMSGSMTDVTIRRETEGLLRLGFAALNAAPAGMIITDAAGSILWSNPAFTVMTGIEADDAVGQTPGRLMKSGVQDAAFYEQFWATLRAGEMWQGEIVNRRKDGSLYHEHMSVTPVKDERGTTTHFVAIKTDLTHERTLQAQYLQAQKLETVGRLAGGIAHDFNNLLTVISNATGLARRGLKDGDPLLGLLGEIRAAGQRAATLTRQLLTFSRRQMVHPEVVHVGTLLEMQQQMVRRVIGEDVALAVLVGRDEARVRVDPGQLEQAILNLAINARDAMPTGGTLTIESRSDLPWDGPPPPDGGPSGPCVTITVADTGTGMDEATASRIFEPFFTTKPVGVGSGLGLSSTYGIVEQAGGTITVSTAPGEGATFTIRLPQVTDAVTEVARATPSDIPSGRETILIVEDDPMVRRLSTRVLAEAGYTVLTANDAANALDLLTKSQGAVDLMLVDVILPGMNGQELMAEVERRSWTPRVLYTSGYTDEEIHRRGILARPAAFIEKPYSASDIARKVRAVLDAPATA